MEFLKDIVTPPPEEQTPEAAETLRQLQSKKETGREVAGSAIAGLGAAWVLGPVGLLFGVGAQYIQDKKRDDMIMSERSRLANLQNRQKVDLNTVAGLRERMANSSRYREGPAGQELYAEDLAILEDIEFDLQQAMYDEMSGIDHLVARGQKTREAAEGRWQEIIKQNKDFAIELEKRDYDAREDDRKLLRGEIMTLSRQNREYVEHGQEVLGEVNRLLNDPAAEGDNVARALLVDYLKTRPEDRADPLSDFLGEMGASGFAVGPKAGLFTLLTSGAMKAANAGGGGESFDSVPVQTLYDLAKYKLENVDRFINGTVDPETGQRTGGQIEYYNRFGFEVHGLSPEEILRREDYSYDDVAGGDAPLSVYNEYKTSANQLKRESTQTEFLQEYERTMNYVDNNSAFRPGPVSLAAVQPIIDSDKLIYGLSGIFSDMGVATSVPELRSFVQRMERQFGLENVRIEPMFGADEQPTGAWDSFTTAAKQRMGYRAVDMTTGNEIVLPLKVKQALFAVASEHYKDQQRYFEALDEARNNGESYKQRPSWTRRESSVSRSDYEENKRNLQESQRQRGIFPIERGNE